MGNFRTIILGHPLLVLCCRPPTNLRPVTGGQIGGFVVGY